MGTLNVRALAFVGRNGIGHGEVILTICEAAGCDVKGLQWVRRNGESVFTTAGYVVEQAEESTTRRATTG